MEIDNILIELLKKKGISRNQQTTVSVYMLQSIAIKYAEMKIKEYADNNETHYEKSKYQEAFKRGFAVGYKKGYCHRSNKAYNRAMFYQWRNHVAADVFKKVNWGGMEIEGELEIIEPEKIIR